MTCCPVRVHRLAAARGDSVVVKELKGSYHNKKIMCLSYLFIHTDVQILYMHMYMCLSNMYMYIHVCVCVCVYIYIREESSCIPIHAHMHMHMHIHMHIHTCICCFVKLLIYSFTHMYTRAGGGAPGCLSRSINAFRSRINVLLCLHACNEVSPSYQLRKDAA